MTEPNYVYLNFEYFLKRYDNMTKYKFANRLKNYVYGDEEKTDRLYLEAKTIYSNFKPDVEASHTAVKKLSNWYKEFLKDPVDVDTLKSRDLAKTNSVSWNPVNVIGDYVGLYLDPTGSGDVKCMFLRLKEDEQKVLRASAFHNLSDLAVLDDKDIDSKDMQDIFNALKNRRGSRLFSGKVDGNGEVVIVELLYGSSRHRSTLTLDISSYLKYVKEENSKRPYSGGLGIQLVSNDIRVDSPYATRLGLIRCDMAEGISLDDEQLKEYLSVTPHSTQWGPLRLDIDKDRLWYEWFMRTHEEFERSKK